MLDTNHQPLIPELRENEGLLDKPSICQAIKECESRFLRTGTYSAYSYQRCLEFTTVLKRPVELSKYMMMEFKTQLSAHNVLTFDFEGDDRQMPPVLIVQCLGSGSVIVLLEKIKQEINDDEPGQIRWLRETLRPLVRAVSSGSVIVIGSSIGKDITKLNTYLGVFSDYHDSKPAFVDTKWLFNAAKRSGLYHRDLVRFLTKRKTREGLGPVALCANSVNHKPYSLNGMIEYLGLDPKSDADKTIGFKEWLKLHHTLKIVQKEKCEWGAPIYNWLQYPLTERQRFYAHLDVVTPLRLLLQYAQKVSHIGKLDLRQETLTHLLDSALQFAARNLPFAVGYKGLTTVLDEDASDDDSIMGEAKALARQLDEAALHDESPAAEENFPVETSTDQEAENSQESDDDMAGSIVMRADAALLDSFKETSTSPVPLPTASTSSTKTSSIDKRLVLMAAGQLPEKRRPNDQEAEASDDTQPEPQVKSKVVVVPNPEKRESAQGRKRSRDDLSKDRADKYRRSHDGKDTRRRSRSRNRRSRSRDRRSQSRRRSRSRDRHSSKSRKDKSPGRSRKRSESAKGRTREKSTEKTQKTKEQEMERSQQQAQQKCDEKSKAEAQNGQVLERSGPPVGGRSLASEGSGPPVGGRSQTSSGEVASKQNVSRDRDHIIELIEVEPEDPNPIDEGNGNETKKQVRELISLGVDHALAADAGLNNSSPKADLISKLKNAESYLAKARALLTTGIFERLGSVEVEAPTPEEPREIEGSKEQGEVEGSDKVLSEAELEDTMISRKSVKWARSPEVFDKLFGRTNPHRAPVRARFMDTLFKYDDPKTRADPRNKQSFIQDPKVCNHRALHPTLTLRSCSHCGLRHRKAMDCAIFRFQEGKELFRSDIAVLSHYPCGYCNSSRHITRLCTTMHAYCKDCQVRGHLPVNKKGKTIMKAGGGKCHITPESLDLQKEKFVEMAPLGHRTSKADALWSYTISTDHACNKQDFSDSEEEV